MKDELDDNDYWSVGNDSECVNIYRKDKFVREYATVDCFHVGCVLYITTLAEWGVGTVLHIDKTAQQCYIHWQKLNITKWHNIVTLLHYLRKDYRGNTENLKNKSFILKG
tara:strand:+ start:812 stop:1141 length:330 start_codon:yes stop_codon:yes gene_type:complete